MFGRQALSYRFVRFKMPWRVKSPADDEVRSAAAILCIPNEKNVKLKNRAPKTFSRIRFDLGQRSRTDVLDFYLPKGIRHRIAVVYVYLIKLWTNYREDDEHGKTRYAAAGERVCLNFVANDGRVERAGSSSFSILQNSKSSRADNASQETMIYRTTRNDGFARCTTKL
jgi:hypothetical protein